MNPDRECGLGQGNPLSPYALNKHLHCGHDSLITMETPSWRFSDNLVFTRQDVTEGEGARTQSEILLQQGGLELRRLDGPPADLDQDQEAQLLGFRIGKEAGQINFILAESAWEGLEEGSKRPTSRKTRQRRPDQPSKDG